MWSSSIPTEKFAVDLQSARDDAKEQRATNKELRESLVKMTSELRKLGNEREAERLKNETLLREQTKAIRTEERERAVEATRLRHLETEKKLTDALADVDRLKTRIEQGSQQSQGEILELDLETQLRELFPEQRGSKEMLAGPIHQHHAVLLRKLLPQCVGGGEAPHPATQDENSLCRHCTSVNSAETGLRYTVRFSGGSCHRVET